MYKHFLPCHSVTCRGWGGLWVLSRAWISGFGFLPRNYDLEACRDLKFDVLSSRFFAKVHDSVTC